MRRREKFRLLSMFVVGVVALSWLTWTNSSVAATPVYHSAAQAFRAQPNEAVICVDINKNYSGNSSVCIATQYGDRVYLNNLGTEAMNDATSSYEIFSDIKAVDPGLCYSYLYRDANEKGPYNIIFNSTKGFHGHYTGAGVANLSGTTYQHGGGAANDSITSMIIACSL